MSNGLSVVAVYLILLLYLSENPVPGGRAGTPGASYDRTRTEQSSKEDREARLDLDSVYGQTI